MAVRRPGHPAAWVRAVAVLVTSAALSLARNWWRLAQPGADTEALVAVGGVTLVALPTGVGVASGPALLLVSAVGVLLLLFRAHAGIAVGGPAADRSPPRPSGEAGLADVASVRQAIAASGSPGRPSSPWERISW